MELHTIILQDKNGKLYELDSPWYNENFSYDDTEDRLKEITTDDWKYYDANDYVIVVNNFADSSETRIQTNVYVALKKDIEKEVSVHNVMKQVEEMI